MPGRILRRSLGYPGETPTVRGWVFVTPIFHLPKRGIKPAKYTIVWSKDWWKFYPCFPQRADLRPSILRTHDESVAMRLDCLMVAFAEKARDPISDHARRLP